MDITGIFYCTKKKKDETAVEKRKLCTGQK